MSAVEKSTQSLFKEMEASYMQWEAIVKDDLEQVTNKIESVMFQLLLMEFAISKKLYVVRHTLCLLEKMAQYFPGVKLFMEP